MNKQAPELSPEARRLIADARGADDPTADDQARVKARWLASVAAVAGVSSLTEAARAAGGIGWGLKAAGAALAVAAGAIGLNFMLEAGDTGAGATAAVDTARQSGASPSEASPSEATTSGTAAALPGSGGTHERFRNAPPGRAMQDRSVVDQAPDVGVTEAEPSSAPLPPLSPALEAREALAPPAALVASPSPAASKLPEPKASAAPPVSPRVVRPKPAGPVARRASTPMPAEKVAAEKEAVATPTASASEASRAPLAGGPSGQLSEELALLSDVRSNIQEGAPVRALELLSRYEARFGQPILGMEAAALRVDALCRAGRREAARESARAFQNDWPGSPLQRRVSAACP